MTESAGSSLDAPLRGEASVLLPYPLGRAFDYAIPEDMDLVAGDHVAVPLGPRLVPGIIWGPGTGTVAASRLKMIDRRYPVPPMPANLRKLIDWVASYTLADPGLVLKLSLRSPETFEPPAPVTAYQRGPHDPVKMTPARARILDLVADGLAYRAADLAERAGVSAGVIKALAAQGVLAATNIPAFPRPAEPDWRRRGPSLSADQAGAAQQLAGRILAGTAGVTLLEGVTGSGKTEVYFEAVAAALSKGRQVLILLPEIALTVQFLERFAERFGVRPVEWHSDVGPARRRANWRAVAEGHAAVVVGARSALFLPFPNLGLIIVDEEHDAAFKQEDLVIYHARDAAVMRAHLEKIPLILASATPSLETVWNVKRGRYAHVHLPERHGVAELPEIRLIDLKQQPPPRGRFLSGPLAEAMAQTVEAGEQVLLFLNRRGYAPLTLCRVCGHRVKCPNCSSWLVEHRFQRRLTCHHCGHHERAPSQCPSCQAADSLVPCGPGVERVLEETKALLPDRNVALFSSDQIFTPQAARDIIDDFTNGKIDVLIGTQVVAKGHHFPNLTLVGVVDADLGLSGGDPRAAERTYQLLSQVSGRAGRAERPGRAFLQTWLPEHPVMQALASGDRAQFVAVEERQREADGLPPFGRLAAIIVSGPDETDVNRTAQALARTAPRGERLDVLGPAPAPLSLLRGQYRVRLLLHAARDINVPAQVRSWLSAQEIPAKVRVTVDIDPYSFF